MQDTGYACYLRLRLKPEKRAEFIGLITKLRADTRREFPETCFYEVLATADPLEFVLMQGFPDEATYKRYANAPYHLEMAPHGWACLDGEPHIEFLKPVAAP